MRLQLPSAVSAKQAVSASARPSASESTPVAFSDAQVEVVVEASAAFESPAPAAEAGTLIAVQAGPHLGPHWCWSPAVQALL